MSESCGRRGGSFDLERGLVEDHSAILAALYLRGAVTPFQPPPRRALEVRSALRRACTGLSGAAKVLRDSGLYEEACALEAPGLLGWAQRQVARGRVLTACCAPYPFAWESKLDLSAPPALWRDGLVSSRPLVAVVGSRVASCEALRFAFEFASRAVEVGFGVVSGGAKGCDTWAARGALQAWESLGAEMPFLQEPVPLVEIHPMGLALRPSRRPGCALSAAAPREPFHPLRARERNVWIAAMAHALVVCEARLGEGGAWFAASNALRLKLCPVYVRKDASDPALAALASLGAMPLETPDRLPFAFEVFRAPVRSPALSQGLNRT
ncbi:MAG: DNA-processing protein DprA [Armatimonadetes bacterium]|nr:DNA-processing protein DprA [Armatimonadota bacterium]